MADQHADRDEDLQLLRSWEAGDRRAGEKLYDRYFDIVYRFFRSKVPEHTQDLTQATMEALLQSSARFAATGSFRSFVLGIAYNVFRQHLRHRVRDRGRLTAQESSCEDLGLGPFEMVSGSQEQKLLVKALRRIPIEHQIVIELHYWEEMNSREIGAVLGVPASTVRDRRQRARMLLRRQLDALMDSDQRVESTLVGLQTWATAMRRHAQARNPTTKRSPP